MSRLMYDSVDPNAIPTNAEMVAGYVDGRFVWPQSGWDRFPNAVKVRIAVFASTNDGDVLDVETGDATPSQAPGWVKNRIAAGIGRPSIYCNRDTWPAVQQACSGLPVDYWIATLDGTQSVPGASAVQYAGSAITGQNYDLSLVTNDTWPGGDMALDPNDPTVQNLTNAANAVLAKDASKDPSGNPMDLHWTAAWTWSLVQDLKTQVEGLQSAVAKLSQPIVNVDTTQFGEQVATILLQKLSKDTAAG